VPAVSHSEQVEICHVAARSRSSDTAPVKFPRGPLAGGSERQRRDPASNAQPHFGIMQDVKMFDDQPSRSGSAPSVLSSLHSLKVPLHIRVTPLGEITV